MREAADTSMLAASMPPEFKFYALTYAAHVYNRSPTSANSLGSGEAPFTTLGLPEGLQRLVPFGNDCVVTRAPTAKGQTAMDAGALLAFRRTLRAISWCLTRW